MKYLLTIILMFQLLTVQYQTVIGKTSHKIIRGAPVAAQIAAGHTPTIYIYIVK